jgi:hypothetical protein
MSKEWKMYFKDLNVEAQTSLLEFDGENMPAAILNSEEPIFSARVLEEGEEDHKDIKRKIIDMLVNRILSDKGQSCDPEKCAKCDRTNCRHHPDNNTDNTDNGSAGGE